MRAAIVVFRVGCFIRDRLFLTCIGKSLKCHIRSDTPGRGLRSLNCSSSSAIIAILAAILFPIFRTGPREGTPAACSTTQTVGLGLCNTPRTTTKPIPELFGSLWPTNPQQANSPQYKWMDAIYPYVKK